MNWKSIFSFNAADPKGNGLKIVSVLLALTALFGGLGGTVWQPAAPAAPTIDTSAFATKADLEAYKVTVGEYQTNTDQRLSAVEARPLADESIRSDFDEFQIEYFQANAQLSGNVSACWAKMNSFIDQVSAFGYRMDQIEEFLAHPPAPSCTIETVSPLVLKAGETTLSGTILVTIINWEDVDADFILHLRFTANKDIFLKSASLTGSLIPFTFIDMGNVAYFYATDLYTVPSYHAVYLTLHFNVTLAAAPKTNILFTPTMSLD
jgi:hypothetical protein